MYFFRRPNRMERSSQTSNDEPLFISDLYGDVHPIAGRIVNSLIDSDQKAGARLLDATLHASPLLHGLVTLVEHFDRLAGIPGLDEDIAGLFRQSSETTSEGFRACIYDPGPRVMDQSRFLMEVEFLLYDLAARPESLEAWRSATPFRRNQSFAFGKLRGRRERDLAIRTGQVLPDRDEYAVHSALVHPRPVRELAGNEQTPQARRSFLIADLADLFGHATRVAAAATVAVSVFTDADTADGAVTVVEAETISRAHDFMSKWHDSLNGLVPLRPESVPLKPSAEVPEQG